MIDKLLRVLGVGAAGLAFAASPVFAQENAHPTALENEFYSISGFCQDVRSDAARTLEDRIKACSGVLQKLDEAKGKAKPLPRETNIYHWMKAYTLMSLGALYVQADKAHSGRACSAVETMWAELNAIDESLAGAELKRALDDAVETVKPSVRQCRSEVGTPKGAIPAPADS